MENLKTQNTIKNHKPNISKNKIKTRKEVLIIMDKVVLLGVIF
jgi:DNA-binding CsgD family transcriptional regulator